MNTLGDGEEGLEPLGPGFPLSAPVAADTGQSRADHLYASHSVAPAPVWPVRTSADDLPPGHPYAAHPTPASVPAPEATPGPAWAGREGHVAAVGRGGDERAPESPAAADYLFTGGPAGEPPDDPNRVILRKQLDALRARAASAASWQDASAHYAQLVNSEGVVPVTARLSRDDIEFLGRAREEVLGLAELALRLLDLHAPLDAGGISTDPSSPIMRCRSCMWRWPCPTFSMLSETVNQLPHPRSPLAR